MTHGPRPLTRVLSRPLQPPPAAVHPADPYQNGGVVRLRARPISPGCQPPTPRLRFARRSRLLFLCRQYRSSLPLWHAAHQAQSACPPGCMCELCRVGGWGVCTWVNTSGAPPRPSRTISGMWACTSSGCPPIKPTLIPTTRTVLTPPHALPTTRTTRTAHHTHCSPNALCSPQLSPAAVWANGPLPPLTQNLPHPPTCFATPFP